jgi:hypothetical protein
MTGDDLGVIEHPAPNRLADLASYLRIEERELEAGGLTESEGRARATPLDPKSQPVVLNAWLRPKCATFCPRWTPTSLDRR